MCCRSGPELRLPAQPNNVRFEGVVPATPSPFLFDSPRSFCLPRSIDFLWNWGDTSQLVLWWGKIMFERLFLVVVVSTIVVWMFRTNLEVARRCLRPLVEDERMDADGLISDRLLFQKTIAHAFQRTVQIKLWMIEAGKFMGALIAFEFWHFHMLWQTYLFLLPIGGYAFLIWVANNHITIVDRRINRLSESDRAVVDQMLVTVRRVK